MMWTRHVEVEKLDYGDEDLQQALQETARQHDVCAVLFGHMHHRLHHLAGRGILLWQAVSLQCSDGVIVRM